jgi:hypothetical protein
MYCIIPSKAANMKEDNNAPFKYNNRCDSLQVSVRQSASCIMYTASLVSLL